MVLNGLLFIYLFYLKMLMKGKTEGEMEEVGTEGEREGGK